MKREGLLARLRRMDAGELAFRVTTVGRAEAGRIAASCRRPRWEPARLAGLLETASPLLWRAAEALRSRDLAAAHALLREHFAEGDGAFPFPAAALPGLRDRVLRQHPSAAEEARAKASRLRQGRFDLLGYRDVDFSGGRTDPDGCAAIDWQFDPVHGRRPPAEWWNRVRFLDPAAGDHKIVWELNRHQHFLQLGRAAWLTGDPAWRGAFIAHVHGWLAQNPPHVGINWASMLELAFRSLSWLWALHLFAAFPDRDSASSPAPPERPWIPELLLGMHVQLEHVRHNLSRYFSPNTHLSGEALGLYVCGLALPELRAARRWAETGRELLLEQIPLQIAPDGGHCERSTHYLRYTLDFYLMALAFARSAGDGAAAKFEEACGRLAGAVRSLADSSGRLPLIGDDDGGRLWAVGDREPNDVRDSLALAGMLLARPDLPVGPPPEEPFWLVGSGPALQEETRSGTPRPGRPSEGGGAGRAECREARPEPGLPNTGFYVARPRPDDHLVIDGGPHGFLNGGHAHADALSVVYTLGGRPLAIDPGTFTYTMSREWRDRLRHSAWHNTLTLDGRSQSVPDGPFHWKRTADSWVQEWVAGDGYHFFEGVHDGYLPCIHRRRVVALESGCVVVVDSVLGEGEHSADVHWHIDSAWRPDRLRNGRVVFRHRGGAGSALLTAGAEPELLASDQATGLGWQSPVYGRLVPCTAVRLTAGGRLPLLIVSVLSEADAGPAEAVILRGSPGGTGEDDSAGVQLRRGDSVHTLLFTARQPLLAVGPAPADTAGEVRRFAWEGVAVSTGARFAWLAGKPGRQPAVRAASGGPVAIEAEDPARQSGAA